MDHLQRQIGDIWSNKYAGERADSRVNWAGSATVINYVTKLICGEACASVQEAHIRLLRRLSPALPYKRGISVACGIANKEMLLLENNIVEHFDCYELSEEAILKGRHEAMRCNLSERITFHLADALKADLAPQRYDFIYWDNAMHHMLDADAAMQWSRELLADSGCFFMYDFVGPSRFQWTPEQLGIIKNILQSLDDQYFLIPGEDYMWKKEPSMMTVEEMLKADPSEAADSDSIIPAFKKHFNTGTLIPLGGLVYVLALDGIIVNIPEGSLLLNKMLHLDGILARQGHSYFAVAHYLGAVSE